MINDKLKLDILTAVRTALVEDVGSGDATTLSCIPADLKCTASFLTREDCTVAGLPIAQAVFHELDADASFEMLVEEGQDIKAGEVMAVVRGNARALLTGERLALNFLQKSCAIAT